MIALLSCFINSLESKAQAMLSTGGVKYTNSVSDSVYVAYDDLRIVNSKLIELRYTKDINNKLRTIIHNDSIIIAEQKIKISNLSDKYSKTRNQRNIAIGGNIILIVLCILIAL